MILFHGTTNVAKDQILKEGFKIKKELINWRKTTNQIYFYDPTRIQYNLMTSSIYKKNPKFPKIQTILDKLIAKSLYMGLLASIVQTPHDLKPVVMVIDTNLFKKPITVRTDVGDYNSGDNTAVAIRAYRNISRNSIIRIYQLKCDIKNLTIGGKKISEIRKKDIFNKERGDFEIYDKGRQLTLDIKEASKPYRTIKNCEIIYNNNLNGENIKTKINKSIAENWKDVLQEYLLRSAKGFMKIFGGSLEANIEDMRNKTNIFNCI